MDDSQTSSMPTTPQELPTLAPGPEETILPQLQPVAQQDERGEPMLAPAETGHAKPGVHLQSKKTLFRVLLVVAILNPVASGILVGIYLWREPEMKHEGKIITAVALVWGVVVLILALANPAKGLFAFSR
ncbi:MAG: hypothetical protein Q7S09_03745 [bacterium]|nr:hypothetical protein [bacterium]